MQARTLQVKLLADSWRGKSGLNTRGGVGGWGPLGAIRVEPGVHLAFADSQLKDISRLPCIVPDIALLTYSSPGQLDSLLLSAYAPPCWADCYLAAAKQRKGMHGKPKTLSYCYWHSPIGLLIDFLMQQQHS